MVLIGRWLQLPILALALGSMTVQADIWIDEDGLAYTDINTAGKYIELTSIERFEYYEAMFQAAIAGESMRLCYGDKLATRMASDCLEGFYPNIRSEQRATVRHIRFDMTEFPFTLRALNTLLREGETLSISIDNGKKFYTTTVNDHYRMKAQEQD